jgi:hypothetical protein
MFTVAASKGVTMPDDEPTVAIPPLLLVHTPPGVAEVKVVVWLKHTTDGPVMADGAAVTVTTLPSAQPDGII